VLLAAGSRSEPGASLGGEPLAERHTEVLNQDIVQLPAQAAFPKAARLLKTDEYSSVFRLRPWRRSPHFVLYGKPTGNEARLGLVVGKKQAPRAVTRNLIKRLAREAFRLRRGQLRGFDILVRLHAKIDRKTMQSASSLPLNALCRGELEGLLDRAVREATRRAAETVVAAPNAPAADDSSGPSGS
jgi:ribonuclease P protein component